LPPEATTAVADEEMSAPRADSERITAPVPLTEFAWSAVFVDDVARTPIAPAPEPKTPAPVDPEPLRTPTTPVPPVEAVPYTPVPEPASP
jgi:hypothetical protein